MVQENNQQPPSEEDPVHYQSNRRNQPLVMAGVLAITALMAWFVVADIGVRITSIFGLGIFSFLSATGLFTLLTGRGKDLTGLLVDGEGIVDQSTAYPLGRISWDEIREVSPYSPSFLGIRRSAHWIGINVSDAYFETRSGWPRIKVWINRHLFRMPDLLLSATNLQGSRDEVVQALTDRLDRYELRSIAEVKKLESGGK